MFGRVRAVCLLYQKWKNNHCADLYLAEIELLSEIIGGEKNNVKVLLKRVRKQSQTF